MTLRRVSMIAIGEFIVAPRNGDQSRSNLYEMSADKPSVLGSIVFVPVDAVILPIEVPQM